jgi:asparagine synthase (glutamine-hydrolysing)
MCGIAGFLDCSVAGRTPSSTLHSTLAALRHRGPDDQGLWSSPGQMAHLLHTRLAIIDLSPGGHQPMSTPDGRFTIVFNGEIYNFSSLRQSLKQEGVTFTSHSDTEVLLHLFAAKGPAMLADLRGMFAFCIWDEQTQSAFLARDPMGIKPLYYCIQPDRLLFASELQAIRKTGLVSAALDSEAVTQFLETGSVPEPMTLLRDARCLEAGHSLTWTDGKAQFSRWWSLQFPDVPPVPNPETITRNALLDSMQAHFVSDEPVGIFLSGGIDSTALVALTRELDHQNTQTFSIGVDDPSLDETSVARRTAQHFQSQHHEWRLTASIAQITFESFLNSMDQPSIDGFNTFTVSSFANKQGMKVVLSGLGSDELFGGYPSFQKVPNLAKWGRFSHSVPGLAPVLSSLLLNSGLHPKWHRLGSFLRHPPTLSNAYRAFRGIFSPAEARHIASRYVEQPALSSIASTPTSTPTEQDAVSALELTSYMRNQLLRDSDVMSMASGLELRVPFVDRFLFETVAQIPAAQRLQPGKKLLLQAVPEIPEWVTNQPKRCFTFPFEKWLETSWGDAFNKATNDFPSANSTWHQRWAIFMLERWIINRP